MGEWVGRDHGRGTGGPQDLDQQEAERSAAEDAGAAAQRGARQIRGVERDAERLEQCRLRIGDGVRQGMEAPPGPAHGRAKRAIRGSVTGEPAGLTEVRPAGRARLTGKARDGGVGHDAQAGVGAILDDPRELVAEDEWTLEARIADRPFLVPSDVRAAQADRGHPQAYLSSAGRTAGSRWTRTSRGACSLATSTTGAPLAHPRTWP